jgi:hypothetical protein
VGLWVYYKSRALQGWFSRNCYCSVQSTAVLREIILSGLEFFEVDSALLKKEPAGCVHRYENVCAIFMRNGVDLKKNYPHTSDLTWVRYHQQNINGTLIMPLMPRLLLV